VTMYYCEPKWHNDEKVDAAYLILAPDDVARFGEMGAFACCTYHLSLAMNVMLEKHGTVKVRKVSNAPSNQSPEGV